ncbi:chemotaxis protein CheW [Teredinibacter sp. KSP-S5-2]|uniref:chemotaxis protein CheW n=1 Tax=Teredinibacter sp. KSP-S5-2 TaxID=3034506 RepID=UPI002934DADA|nr:chemotaxis protein CheW [Teredinibacter sp. KSP-S5-2]WNO11685.1 chemotaxis protein CheW [Teredinibacter sp. KSP-S5-2]
MSNEITDTQWISFQLGGETYLLPIDDVREVTPYSPPNPVPGAPTAIEGVLNIRGEVVSILSGQRIMGLKQQQSSENAKIIILENTLGIIGLCVDSIGEIVTFEPSQIETNTHTSDQNLIKGTIHLNDHLMILFDLNDYCSNLITHTQS